MPETEVAEIEATGVPDLLHMAMELSTREWRVRFCTNGGKAREASVTAGDVDGLMAHVEKAKGKLGLSPDCAVVSCYEAGRDGFWIHHALTARGIFNQVVDSASVPVERRGRHAKTDRLDVKSLCTLLVRATAGEDGVWRIVRVPGKEVEDERRVQRELDRLIQERTAHRARLRSLLALEGIRVGKLRDLRSELPDLTRWDGEPLGEHLRAELERECRRLEGVEEMIKEVEAERDSLLAEAKSQAANTAAKLTTLKGVGKTTATALAYESLGWRVFSNRKDAGASTGLVGTPYSSGKMKREQGISKAGSARVRRVMVEFAWGWLRHQPGSALTRWWYDKFGLGSGRQKRVGIAALARRLFIALWRYVKFGVVPEGALVRLQTKKKAKTG